METRERLLALVGACNFRDLGGYPTVGGGIISWGSLFRSDSLHELTEADFDVLREVGLAGVVDLRTATEVERTGRGRLGEKSIQFLHAPVLGVEGGASLAMAVSAEENAAERYLWYLDAGSGAFVRALHFVADPANRPVVFHCAAGKDRTGVLAALILDILGVEHSVIVEDYAITATRIELIFERLRRDPVWGDVAEDIPTERIRVDPVIMEDFLHLLDQRHGGAYEWALAAGVSIESLHAMRAQLVLVNE